MDNGCDRKMRGIGGSAVIGKCVVIDRHVRISRHKGGLVNKAKVDMLM